MGAVARSALRSLVALGPRGEVYANFLGHEDKGFVTANAAAESFPLVAKSNTSSGYGLFCGPRLVRAGEIILRVPPPLWVPYCAEAAVRKAEVGAPDFLSRLGSICRAMGGGKWVAPFSCLALEMLFTLERDRDEPYLGLLWEMSRSHSITPHPLLLGLSHLNHLQASPLRKDIELSSRIYSTLHRSLFGLEAAQGHATPPSEVNPSSSSTYDFLWALGVILSRAVTEEGAGGAGLVPYLDFVNHGNPSSLSPGCASCERAFDEATGSHILRALRDISPGEELLIDYGSQRKGMYRFARTYGFLPAVSDLDGDSQMQSPPKDIIRVSVELASSSLRGSHFGARKGHPSRPRLRSVSESRQDPVDVRYQTENARPSSEKHTSTEGASPRVCSSEHSESKVCDDEDLPHDQRVADVEIPVNLMDVTNAASSRHGSSEGTSPACVSTNGNVSATGEEDDEAVTCPIGKALRARLASYDTLLEEDLKNLESLSDSNSSVVGPNDTGHRSASGLDDRCTPEWEEVCLRIRIAEKIALRRALRERGGEPPAQ